MTPDDEWTQLQRSYCEQWEQWEAEQDELDERFNEEFENARDDDLH